MRNSTAPVTVEYLRDIEREMQENSTAVPTDSHRKQQTQQRQEANPLPLSLPREIPTSSSPHQTSQVMSSQPRTSQLLLQQREAAAQMRASRAIEMEMQASRAVEMEMRASRAAEMEYFMQVERERQQSAAQMRASRDGEIAYLLQITREREERALAAHLQNRASGMLPRPQASSYVPTLGSSTIPANVPVYRPVGNDLIWVGGKPWYKVNP